MMSFAQRKFMGFRCKYEYDTKAILLCTDKQLLILTYTLESLGESTVDILIDQKKQRFAGTFNQEMQEIQAETEQPDESDLNQSEEESK